MDDESLSRITINDLEDGILAHADELERIADKGKRRYRAFSMDFDTRSNMLSTEIEEAWQENVKAQWRTNRDRLLGELSCEFGGWNLDRKVADLVAIGPKPMSIISHHNAFFHQVRTAFVAGAYYPALTGACALGERILNHLVLDLRSFFKSSPEYKRVHSKKSFNNWDIPIGVLVAWKVLLPDVAKELRALMTIRHRSIHFNADTSDRLRDDALAAIVHMREIVGRQFGTFGTQPWFIEGVQGAAFIKREYQTDPFIRSYYLPQCPFVGVLSGIEFDEQRRSKVVDFHDYGDGALTDDEFRKQYNSRDPTQLARSA